jgi:hypothetical protein
MRGASSILNSSLPRLLSVFPKVLPFLALLDFGSGAVDEATSGPAVASMRSRTKVARNGNKYTKKKREA